MQSSNLTLSTCTDAPLSAVLLSTIWATDSEQEDILAELEPELAPIDPDETVYSF